MLMKRILDTFRDSSDYIQRHVSGILRCTGLWSPILSHPWPHCQEGVENPHPSHFVYLKGLSTVGACRGHVHSEGRPLPRSPLGVGRAWLREAFAGYDPE